jgi:hypothetical protein
MDAVAALAPTVGVRAACRALGVARATFYRRRVARHRGRPRPDNRPAGRGGPATEETSR